MSNVAGLDRDRIRELFDLRSGTNETSGGGYEDDPHPVWHRLRESGPIHEGIVHELTGYNGQASFWGCEYEDRPHFSAFSFDACDQAFRDNELFASKSSVGAGDGSTVGVSNSMLTMGGKDHRRYRALVQPSFIPAKAKWWRQRWIEETVDGLIDQILPDGKADLNVDFCAAIPMLTITGSFGIPIADALDLREVVRAQAANAAEEFVRIVSPVVAARRNDPADDLISVLVEAEITDEDGRKARLSDEEIYSFSYLLLSAGSGTTWKQMGITLAALLRSPELLAAARDDEGLLRACIEESLRWSPTDPAFPRFVQQDIEFHGTKLPAGSVLQLCLSSANRDPSRWERPDEFDPRRPVLPALAFGNGPHVCLGMHVARAEMLAGISALLRRLPNLRLDPDAAAPRIIGFYERGVTELPVVFG